MFLKSSRRATFGLRTLALSKGIKNTNFKNIHKKVEVQLNSCIPKGEAVKIDPISASGQENFIMENIFLKLKTIWRIFTFKAKKSKKSASKRRENDFFRIFFNILQTIVPETKPTKFGGSSSNMADFEFYDFKKRLKNSQND